MIDIALIESNTLLQEGYKQVLEAQTSYNVTLQSSNCVSLRQTNQDYDLILLDIPAFIRYKEDMNRCCLSSKTKMAVLAQKGEEHFVVDAINAGFHAFLFKEMEASEFLRAIVQVLDHQFYIHGQATHYLLTHDDSIVRPKKQSIINDVPLSPLNKKPFQVLQYIAQGLSNQEIADKLKISSKTVKNHVYIILDVLEVRNRTEAVIKAVQNGWITLHENL